MLTSARIGPQTLMGHVNDIKLDIDTLEEEYIARGKDEERARLLKTRLMFYKQSSAHRQWVPLLLNDLEGVKLDSKTLLKMDLNYFQLECLGGGEGFDRASCG